MISQGEDHEAGIVAAMQAFGFKLDNARDETLLRQAIAAYLSRRSSPVSGTESENSGQRGMRDYLAMKRRPSMAVSGTEPDTPRGGATLWVKKCPVDWCGVRWIEGSRCPRGHTDEPIVERFYLGGTEPDTAKLDDVRRVLRQVIDAHSDGRAAMIEVADEFLAGF